MIIIDIETTGVSFSKHSIVSVGALEFENPGNQFYGECRVWDGAHISDEALKVNSFSEAEVTDSSKQTDADLIEAMLEWAQDIEEHTPAGHNVSAFDLPFLKATAHRHSINWPWPDRSVDTHSLVYMHLVKRGVTPPTENGRTAINSAFVREYVGIETDNAHDALADAKWAAEAISRLLYAKPLLDDFSHQPLPNHLL